MRFLVSLFKASPKGDNFRPVQNPVKYTNRIAALNASGDNQYAKVKDIATVVRNTSPN